MSLFMNSSQEETFQTLIDYFVGRRNKILFSNKPNLIRAEIGAYWAMSRGNAKGEVETTIAQRNEGSYVNFNFSFTKEYIMGVIASFIGTIIAYFLGWGVANAMISRMPFANIADLSLIINGILAFGIIMIFLMVMAMEGQNASTTKKKFIAEFDMFAKSLPNRTPPPP